MSASARRTPWATRWNASLRFRSWPRPTAASVGDLVWSDNGNGVQGGSERDWPASRWKSSARPAGSVGRRRRLLLRPDHYRRQRQLSLQQPIARPELLPGLPRTGRLYLHHTIRRRQRHAGQRRQRCGHKRPDYAQRRRQQRQPRRRVEGPRRLLRPGLAGRSRGQRPGPGGRHGRRGQRLRDRHAARHGRFRPRSGRLQPHQRRPGRRLRGQVRPQRNAVVGPRPGWLGRRRRRRHRPGTRRQPFTSPAAFRPRANFPSGSNDFSLLAAGGEDIFVAKLDSLGNVLWARGMGGAGGDDAASGVAVAPDGSVYTTGSFQGTADFDPGSGVHNLAAIGPKDVFVSKLDAAGNFVWADRMGGTGWSQGMSIGTAIALGPDGSVYTTGSFQGTADFGLGDAAGILTCAGDTDVFVSKLDAAGNFVWARDMGGTQRRLRLGHRRGRRRLGLHHRRTDGHGRLRSRRAGPTTSTAPATTACSYPSWIRRAASCGPAAPAEPVGTWPPASPWAPTAASTPAAASGARPISIPTEEPRPSPASARRTPSCEARFRRQLRRRPRHRQRHKRQLRGRHRRDLLRRGLHHRLLPGHGQLQPRRKLQSQQRRRPRLLPGQGHPAAATAAAAAPPTQPATFAMAGPTSGTYQAGKTVNVQWNGRQRRGRQHDQPLLRQRRELQRQRTLDRDRRRRRRRWHGQLRLEHQRHGGRHVLHRPATCGTAASPSTRTSRRPSPFRAPRL